MQSKYHQRFLSVEERFWQKVQKTDSCWIWTAGKNSLGYGYFWLDGRYVSAHRVAYELAVGPIPDGLQVDHVKARGCAGPPCVNPAHLEPVTPRENTRRAGNGNRNKTHCPQGHPYDEANTYHYTRLGGMPMRQCAICTRERVKARYWACKKVMK